MNRRDLEARKVEAFAKHIDADDTVERTIRECRNDAFDVAKGFVAGDHLEPKLGMSSVKGEQLRGAFAAVGAHHDPVLEPTCPVLIELVLGSERDRDVRILQRNGVDRLITDDAEYAILEGLAEVIGENETASNFALVLAEGRCGEQDALRLLEVIQKRLPRSGWGVMGLVDQHEIEKISGRLGHIGIFRADALHSTYDDVVVAHALPPLGRRDPFFYGENVRGRDII
jgi:hypothetical protein